MEGIYEFIAKKEDSTGLLFNKWSLDQLATYVNEYILTQAKNNDVLDLVSGCFPDESELAEAVDTAIYKSDCSTKPWIKEFKEQLELSGYEIIESNNR